MTPGLWLAYVATLSVVSFSPGTGAAAVISNALSHGAWRTFPVVLGMQAALLFYALVVAFGLAAVVSHGPVLAIIRWSGVAYLVWLGLRTLFATTSELVPDSRRGTARSWGTRFSEGLLVNLTNPKTTIFMAALFPQFLSPAEPLAPQLLLLCLTLVVVDTIVMMGYAYLASAVRLWLNDPRRAASLNRVTGVWFLILALILAMGSPHG